MTVIAAIVHDGRVFLAADSAATGGDGRRWPTRRKLIRVPVGRRGEHAIFGSCGHSGFGALTRAGQVELPVEPFDDDDDADAWADGVARAVTDMAVDARPPLTEDDGHLAGHLLLALRGRLWGISEHTAFRFPRVAAIGSGGDLALGALEVLVDQVDAGSMLPQDAVAKAAEIACRWDSGCFGEVQTASTESDTESESDSEQ